MERSTQRWHHRRYELSVQDRCFLCGCQSGDSTTLSTRGVGGVTFCSSRNQQNEESRAQFVWWPAKLEEMVQR